MASRILFRHGSECIRPDFASPNALTCTHCGQPSVVPCSLSVFMVILRRRVSVMASFSGFGWRSTSAPISILTASHGTLEFHGVTVMFLRSSSLQRSAIGRRMIPRALIIFPSPFTTRYVLDTLLYPRKMPGIMRGPMLPLTSCCGPFAGCL